MKTYWGATRAIWFVLGAITAVAGLGLVAVLRMPAALAEEKPPQPAQGFAELQSEMARLKGIIGDQSHAMADVGYHFANLWFAGQRQNWPLADFYWAETRSHLRWAVRIMPVRKDPQGREIRLEEILEPIDRTALQMVSDAIKAKDKAVFTQKYREMLDSCYACHAASGKAFLRPRIPDAPGGPIIDFEPQP